MKKHCTNCGKELYSGANFCTKCGAEVFDAPTKIIFIAQPEPTPQAQKYTPPIAMPKSFASPKRNSRRSTLCILLILQITAVAL